MALTKEQMFEQFIKHCGKIQQIFNNEADDKEVK